MHYDIGFMVIRYNGLKNNIIEDITNTIAEYKSIEVKGIYPIEWSKEEKKKKLLDFYKHIRDESIIKDIMEINGLIMVGVILYDSMPVVPPSTEKVSGKNWNMVSIKRKIREKFGNVVHLSDSVESAYSEILKLLDIGVCDVNSIIKNKHIALSVTRTNNYLIERFNKIKDGNCTLWTPKK